MKKVAVKATVEQRLRKQVKALKAQIGDMAETIQWFREKLIEAEQKYSNTLEAKLISAEETIVCLEYHIKEQEEMHSSDNW